MPHKHKRKRDDDNSQFDLAPTTQAKPLPAYKPPSVFTSDQDGPSNKRRKGGANKLKSQAQDDTPKAFARMMAWQAAGKRPSGLDDGTRLNPKSSKKKQPQQRKNKKASTDNIEADQGSKVMGVTSETIPETLAEPTKSSSITKPEILPGESLSDFARRVDQSLPLTSIPKTSGRSNTGSMPEDIKPRDRLTKHNKRLQKMISDWRAEDTKRKEKREEEDDDMEEKRDEEDLLWDGVRSARLNRKGKKKQSKKIAGAVHDDDPWKNLEKQRREAKQKNLQDVVKAPPSLVKVKSKFKIKDEDFAGVDGSGRAGAAMDDGDVGVDVKDVPNSVGSLRRREEIGRTRREIIEGYRKRRLKGKNLGGAPGARVTMV